MALYYEFGGFPEQQDDSTVAVSYWEIPGGCDYSNACVALAYFSNEENAKRFVERYSYPPEMAFIIELDELKKIRLKIAEQKEFESTMCYQFLTMQCNCERVIGTSMYMSREQVYQLQYRHQLKKLREFFNLNDTIPVIFNS